MISLGLLCRRAIIRREPLEGRKLEIPGISIPSGGSMEEEVLGVIEKAEGGTGRLYTLYMTSTRFVGINLGSPGIAFLAGGVVGAALSQRAAGKRAEQYRGISLESQLRSDKKNFAIPYAAVNEVVLKPEGLSRATIRIVGAGENIKLALPKKRGYFELAERALSDRVPGKLVIK